jgi:DNA-binding response OmpR family regulator
MSVFVVEDDKDMRRFVAWLLTSRTSHDVFSFETAEEALTELHRREPSLLLTDLGLPGLSGEELARVASRLPNPPRIVLMSGDRSRLEDARSVSAAVLRKPFSMAELMLVVEQSMEES